MSNTPRSFEISRRQLLAAGGGLALSLSLSRLAPAAPRDGNALLNRAVPDPTALSYQGWGDLWRDRWVWDRVVRTSHVRANCISACSWNVFVKDGIAWYEEQNAIYEASEEGVPDFNPRGCQKGACFTHVMYEPSRIMHPLRRVGPRGSGKWKRVSWDEALTEIAESIIDASVKDGTGAVVYDHGTTNVDFGPDTASELRLFHALSSSVLDSWAGVGDMPYGAVQTWGLYNSEGTSDDWFKSDFIVVWIGNPDVTRMPEAHFMHEARYRGAKVVVIAPDYSQTAVHADYWLNPRMGTDAALGLAMAQVILSEGLHDEEYIREQTDLPILVREDTGRYLRDSDLRRGGKDDFFYYWDETQDKLAAVPGCQGEGGRSLALGGLKPALSGRWPVKLVDGKTVHVRPMIEDLRKHVNESYTPEQAAQITGVGPETIRRIARELAAAPRAMIFSSWGACKHYHSDLFQRTKILLMALTGNQGKSGAGLRIAAWWRVEGFERLAYGVGTIPLALRLRLLWRVVWGTMGWREFEDFMQEMKARSGDTPLMPWLYVHAGYNKVWDRPDFQDPAVPRPTSEYMKEAVEKGWIPIRPLPGIDPKVFIFTGPNPLRRWPAPQIALENLWPKLAMVVDVNFKVSTSGLHADYILPAAGYYERDSIKYSQVYVPYIMLCEKAVDPLGESKPEWEMFGLLARKIQERARARGVTKVRDSVGVEDSVDLSRIYEEWSDDGKFHESNARAALEFVLENTRTTGGKPFAEAKKTGLLPVVESSGRPDAMYALGTDFKPGQTLYPHARFVEDKECWPTLTGRQQFLLDHPWYEEVGETLPVHKEMPLAGGNYPLRINGGHTRWSIHATWRDSPLMLRLQRGEPALWMSNVDAKQRGITDGDRVRVYNDVGSFEALAKVAGAVQPGEIIIYHAWEPYQHRGWKGQQEPVPAPWKPIQLLGDYGQLHYRAIYGAPGHVPRGMAVEVVPA